MERRIQQAESYNILQKMVNLNVRVDIHQYQDLYVAIFSGQEFN